MTIALARPLPDGYVSTQDDRHVIRRLAGAQWRRGGHSWACLAWMAFIGQQTSVSRDLPGIAENNSSATLRQRCPTASGFVPPIGVYSKATGHFAALGASNGERKHSAGQTRFLWWCAIRSFQARDHAGRSNPKRRKSRTSPPFHPKNRTPGSRWRRVQ